MHTQNRLGCIANALFGAPLVWPIFHRTNHRGRGFVGLPKRPDALDSSGQEARSAMLTWFLANVLDRDIGRLNITILFGFSPRLPFPDNYAAFKSVVDKARAIADSDQRTRPLKVAGAEAGPMERLLAFASQPDSAVDIVRVGMEDTPYILDPSGVLLPATNLLLAQEAVRQIEMNRARVNRPI